MNEKQAEVLLEMLDRIRAALERLVQLQEKPLLRPRRDEPPAWMKDLPSRAQPPEAEL